MSGAVHVIGAGLAGLAAAEAMLRTGTRVVIHEAAPQAGGRCRSYHDSRLGMEIDNGNHLLLSGNKAALGYADRIGGASALSVAEEAAFPFIDLASGERWTLRPNAGRLPRWIFDPARRLPATRPLDYLAPLGLLFAGDRTRLDARMAVHGPLYERLWRPLLLAGLNVEPAEGSARLAAALIRETLALGGDACRPVIATKGLSAAFVDPALALFRRYGTQVRFGASLRTMEIEANAVRKLVFSGSEEILSRQDRVVLAVPPHVAKGLLPQITAPTKSSAILNIHFRIEPPAGSPLLLGLVGTLSEWLFAFPDRLSVTISAADRLLDRKRDDLAREVWREVCAATGLSGALPPWQVIRERRATFRATPAQTRLRPGTRTGIGNLFLAGDWTKTGLPATIEGAIRSGREAARFALAPDTIRKPDRIAA